MLSSSAGPASGRGEDGMKFGLFHVMQRPEHLSAREIYESEMPLMVAADELGYHSVWIAEHHFSDYGVCSAPQVLGAAIAGQTKRLRIGMGITLLPLHDPIAIAEELAVLDVLSGGRLEVGIGRASTSLEYSGFNIPYAESRGRVDEGLEIMRGVWSEPRFSYQGAFREVHDVGLVPRPIQQPHPPVYLASNSPETVPIAARHGLPMMSAFLVLDDALVERREVYRQVSAEHGHPADEVEARLAQTWNIRFVYVSEDEREALETPRDHLMGYLGAADTRARDVPRTRAYADYSYEEHLSAGAAFFGTPSQVVDMIGRFHERTGLDNLLCFMAVRAMDPAKVLRSMELFTTRVMPHFAEKAAVPA
jgi:luciferase family oxidoreductase group 1